MDIKPIRNERDYRKSVRRVELIFDAASGSPEFDELEVLSTLVDAYEERRDPIALPDPVEAIRFRMDQLGLSRNDLEPFMGSRARVSEVLGRKRSMSLTMIRKLHRGLRIPAETLLAE